MQSKTALKIIFIISIAGILFSGYLSYMELFHPAGCSDAIVKCTVGEKPAVDLGTLPACVYGLIMYIIIFVISLLGLTGKKKMEQPDEQAPESPPAENKPS